MLHPAPVENGNLATAPTVTHGEVDYAVDSVVPNSLLR